MTQERMLGDTRAINALTDHLSSLSCIREKAAPSGPHAAQIAFSLGELEKSFRAILDELLPKLLDVKIEETQACDTLIDIGLQLSHINYHLHAPTFFRALVGDHLVEELKQEG